MVIHNPLKTMLKDKSYERFSLRLSTAEKASVAYSPKTLDC